MKGRRGRAAGARRAKAAVVAALATGAVLALGAAAAAETVQDPSPFHLWGVGVNGDDAPTGWEISISQGGCSSGTIAVSIGDPGRTCTAPDPADGEYWYADAGGNALGVGLLSAESRGLVAVSDSGDAEANCLSLLGCWYAGVAATGTGAAEGNDLAVSGTGPATGGSAAVSGAGDASAIGFSAFGGYDPGLLAVSGIGNATARDGAAVSVLGRARSQGCTGDVVEDTTSGYAVSVFGNAYGCNSVSVTGEAGGG